MVEKHSKFSVIVTGLEGQGRGRKSMIHINVYREFYQQMFAMLTTETARDGNEIIPVMNLTVT